MWAEIAMRSGFDAAKARHDAIIAQMNPAQLERSQKLVQKCIESELKECG